MYDTLYDTHDVHIRSVRILCHDYEHARRYYRLYRTALAINS